MNNELERRCEENGRGLFQGTILAFAWRDSEISQKSQDSSYSTEDSNQAPPDYKLDMSPQQPI
jgi:hypothetical protein